MAVVATAMNLLPALAVSWLLVRRRVRGAFVIDLLVSLPLALPPVAIGFFLLLALGREAPLGARGARGLRRGHRLHLVRRRHRRGRRLLPAGGALDHGGDGGRGQAARALGAHPGGRPVAGVPDDHRPPGLPGGYWRGCCSASSGRLSEFGATIVVAGNIAGRTETLPLAVYSNILLGRDEQALRLIGITIALAVVTLAAHNWLLARVGAARGRSDDPAR